MDEQSNTKDKVLFLASNCTTDEWILDSGSTAHITNKKLFKDMKKIKSEIGFVKKL